MEKVSKTLYIPLYGKAYVSRKGIILRDTKAEEIWAREGFPLRGRARSKWLAYYMGMRSAVYDNWVRAQLGQHPSAVVLHIGCGMDSRYERVGAADALWYDIDFAEVIAERRRYFAETDCYRMLPGNARRPGDWLGQISAERQAVVVMEGVSMYLAPEDLTGLLRSLTGHFAGVRLLVDCYTEFAAKASKYRNPINTVGVTQVYGLDSPALLEKDTGLRFVRELAITPGDMIAHVPRGERGIFRTLYGGRMAGRLYRMYELAGAK